MKRAHKGTDPGLLDALIEAQTYVLEALVSQRSAMRFKEQPRVPYGALSGYVYQLLGLSVLPMSPSVIARLIAAHGYSVSPKTVAALLAILKREGKVVSLGRGKWRRVDIDASESQSR